MKKYIKKINEFIDSFLCISSMIMITFFDFITEKLTISKYLERERNGIINHIIISAFMIIFAVPIFIFSRYSKVE